MKLTIIIPVYNEHATIVRVIERLQQSGCEAFEWIFVDDGSTDGTTQLLRENVPSRQKLIVQSSNQGKSAAVREKSFAFAHFVPDASNDIIGVIFELVI